MNEYVLVMLMHESHNIFELQLQEAFAAGLIKPGLNSVQEVTKKRPKINNVAGLKQKLDEFRQHHLPFVYYHTKNVFHHCLI